MADRRMMTKKVIHSDAFMDMPISTQNLYFYLLLDADDDGFVNSPKKIQRMIGAMDDDTKLLLAKKFIISFDSGIIVIKHWKMHNYIQKDRYKPTAHLEEKSKLTLKDNNVYTMDTECIQDGRVGKVRLGKVRLGKESIEATKTSFDFLSCWNHMAKECGISKIQSITKSRKSKLTKRYKDIEDFEDTFLTACELIAQSNFLQGVNNQGWSVTFDWLISNDTNITKVIEGNYNNTNVATKEAPIGSLEWERQQMIKQEDEVIDAKLV